MDITLTHQNWHDHLSPATNAQMMPTWVMGMLIALVCSIAWFCQLCTKIGCIPDALLSQQHFE